MSEINSISLTSFQVLDNVLGYFTFGAVTGDTTDTKKIDMSFINEGLYDLNESVKLPDVFDINKSYQIGDRVYYELHSYKFIAPHVRRAWDSSDVVLDETYFYTLNDRDLYDTFTINIKSYDTNFVKSDILVTAVSVDSGKVLTKRTNSLGSCSFNLNKDMLWNIKTENVNGYVTKPEGLGIDTRNYHFIKSFDVYYTKKRENCRIDIALTLDDGSKTTVASKQVVGMFDDISNSFAASTDANGNCFLNVPKNQKSTFYFPTIDAFTNPENIVADVITDRSKTINVVYPVEIYYVDGSDFNEYLIQDYPFNPDGSYDSVNHPCVSLHVATKSLKNYGFDYYVRLIDLTTQRASSPSPVAAKQWCTAYGTLHPNVTTSTSTTVASAYDGTTMTDAMISDSVNMGQTSPAALYAKTLTYTHNGTTYNGYIGTQVQMNPLFAHSDSVYRALTKFGYTGNYKTGTNWWSSTQYTANNSWRWCSGGYWTSLNKTNSYYVLPFFAIR